MTVILINLQELKEKNPKFFFSRKGEVGRGEPMTSFPNWRCAFEKIRTDFAQNL